MDWLLVPIFVALAFYAVVAVFVGPLLVSVGLLSELTGDEKREHRRGAEFGRRSSTFGLVVMAGVVGVMFLPMVGALISGLACDSSNCDEPYRWDFMLAVAIATPLYWLAFRRTRFGEMGLPNLRQIAAWMLVGLTVIIAVLVVKDWQGAAVSRVTGHALGNDRLGVSVAYVLVVLFAPAAVAWHRLRRGDTSLALWVVLLGAAMMVAAVVGWYGTVGAWLRLPDEGTIDGQLLGQSEGSIRFTPDYSSDSYDGPMKVIEWPAELDQLLADGRRGRRVRIRFEYVEGRSAGLTVPEIRVLDVSDP